MTRLCRRRATAVRPPLLFGELPLRRVEEAPSTRLLVEPAGRGGPGGAAGNRAGAAALGEVDEVALTVLWAWGVVGRMASHVRKADPRIAYRCELVGKALAAVLEENLPLGTAPAIVPQRRLHSCGAHQ